MPGPVTLAEHTTLRVGGAPEAWVVAESAEAVVDAVRAADGAGRPVLVLGGGSNIVVADRGFPGVVVEAATLGIVVRESDDEVTLVVEAGEPWDDLVRLAVDSGWSGIEALSGIPGRCGATPIQNVGAYGQDVSGVLRRVVALDRATGSEVVLDADACGFGYRTSRFKREPDRWVVLRVELALPAEPMTSVRYAEVASALGVPVGGRARAAEVREAVLALRRGKGMVLDDADHDTWSAGSFFTNPVVADDAAFPEACPRYPAAGGVKLSAAWLMEAAGVGRGFALPPGRAAVSSKHALALTNRGSATAADLLALADEVRRRVQARFGVELALEPVLVGFA